MLQGPEANGILFAPPTHLLRSCQMSVEVSWVAPMVISRRLLSRSGVRLRVLRLDGRQDLRNPFKPFHAVERLLAVSQHRPQPTLEHRTPCMRVMFRSLCRTSKNRLSIWLVDSSVWLTKLVPSADAPPIAPRTLPGASPPPTRFWPATGKPAQRLIVELRNPTAKGRYMLTAVSSARGAGSKMAQSEVRGSKLRAFRTSNPRQAYLLIGRQSSG